MHEDTVSKTAGLATASRVGFPSAPPDIIDASPWWACRSVAESIGLITRRRNPIVGSNPTGPTKGVDGRYVVCKVIANYSPNMSMMSRTNTVCAHCSVPIYRKPHQIANGQLRFCTRQCFQKHYNMISEPIKCKICNGSFRRQGRDHIYCSKSCAQKSRAGKKRNGNKNGNASRARLNLLYEMFAFKCCMVEGCEYGRVYDVHRLIEGKHGGEYVVGNMFAICPNHHAEYTRGLIRFEKIDDSHLRAIDLAG